MSGVGASAHVGGTAVRAAATAPPYVWIFLAVITGLSVLVWHRFGQDPEDTDWLDPGQPPINVREDFGSVLPGGATVAGAPATGRRPRKPYSFNSLMQHPGCWIGDC